MRSTCSLINYLTADNSGFVFSLDVETGDTGRTIPAASRSGPYSKTLRADIRTDAGDLFQPLQLLVQRDVYDAPDSLLAPQTNLTVEAAWQRTIAHYARMPEGTGAPIRLKAPIGENGQHLPFQSLFYCQHQRAWFHPVCPQCGRELVLCRDDALLARQGLGTYAGSLERFLYCPLCFQKAVAPALFCYRKKPGMPEYVHDCRGLIARWQQLLAAGPERSGLPCGACSHAEVCGGDPEGAARYIRPFAFYPFHLLIFPAPSCRADEFVRMIAGDPSAVPLSGQATDPTGQRGRLFFHGQDRQFLEILYLKLAFLFQVCRSFLTDSHGAALSQIAPRLDGIGVDIVPSGTGLPDLWNFSVRILDAVGIAQTAPFAPLVPESPQFHFLGALWFHTLLVNSCQTANAVFARVGERVGPLTRDQDMDTLAIDHMDPGDTWSAGQIFWTPDHSPMPETWHAHWRQALRLGCQLVHAGLKSGVPLDPAEFMTRLDTLREAVKGEMFSASSVPSEVPVPPPSANRLRSVLKGILEKWQQTAAVDQAPAVPVQVSAAPPMDEETVVVSSAAAEPPEWGKTAEGPDREDIRSDEDATRVPTAAEDWDSELEETVVFSPRDTVPPVASGPADVADADRPAPPFDPDSEATVILQVPTGGDTPTPPPAADMEQTVVLSVPAPSPPAEEDDLEATLLQESSRPKPPPPPGGDDGLEATLVLNPANFQSPDPEAPAADDDLAATLVQGAGHPQAESSTQSVPAAPENPANSGPQTDELQATVVIRPDRGMSSAAPQGPAAPGSGPVGPATDEDDLLETLIETPRSPGFNGVGAAPDKNSPLPSSPVYTDPNTQPVPDNNLHFPEKNASEDSEDDDTIMEQTIIIRSDVRKE
ncbi:hypothetical protein [Desulfosarcina ovata]|uniref:Uncharacterized protein n=1 Tax=Desulfosarcina ovata subsp. ovata TaxID=2752305 RepID=A0A5K8A8X2_9BACT|nr:hypothetical protein [Desulfosarcina ovata]BBO88784.1 hypothetical protein DSCOOX_19640 [Desulfosarcina ovata subsp. ovata]